MKSTKSFINFFALTSATLLYGFFGCSSHTQDNTPPIDRDALMLETLIEKVSLNEINFFNESVQRLDHSAKQACSGSDQVSLSDLHEQWLESMKSYHRLKVVLFSPISIIEEINPLAHVYNPFYSKSKRGVPKRIREQMELAEAQQLDYAAPNSSGDPSLHGLTALEIVLFGIFNENSLESQSGECVFLSYTTSRLADEVSNLQENWKSSFLQNSRSANGRTDANIILKNFANHIVKYTEQRILTMNFALPMGIIDLENYRCPSSGPCYDRYFEHPFYPDPSIALVEPLKVINSLFVSSDTKSVESSLFTFEDYINSKRSSGNSFKSSETGLTQVLVKLSELPKNQELKTLFDPQSNNDTTEIMNSLTKFVGWLNSDFLIEMSTVTQSVQGDND